jgi:hypothetical protein
LHFFSFFFSLFFSYFVFYMYHYFHVYREKIVGKLQTIKSTVLIRPLVVHIKSVNVTLTVIHLSTFSDKDLALEFMLLFPPKHFGV